jgi:hypothetical protein
MKRRTFISLIGGAAAAWPFGAPAQQSSNKIPVVGVLWHAGSADEEDVYLSVLVKAFNDLGYVEGKNIRLDHRFPAEKLSKRTSRIVNNSCFDLPVWTVQRPQSSSASRVTTGAFGFLTFTQRGERINVLNRKKEGRPIQGPVGGYYYDRKRLIASVILRRVSLSSPQ